MGSKPRKRRRLPTEPFGSWPEGKDDKTRKALVEGLGWSEKRLEFFTSTVAAYRKRPTIESYMKIKEEFPEAEIEVGILDSSWFELLDYFADQGVNLRPSAFITPNEASMDALSLCLMRLMIARGSLPNSGPGYIDKRRRAISDSTINYLIVAMLEAMHAENEPIPGSLVVLVREQLCGSNPDLREAARSKAQLWMAGSFAGKYFYQSKKQISINQLAPLLGVGRSTAARWLAERPDEFRSGFKWGQDSEAARKPLTKKTRVTRTGEGCPTKN
jgi:hypothetical protein